MNKSYEKVWREMQKYAAKYPDDFAGPLESEKEIKDIESKIGLHFSDGYKKYLRLYGGGGPGEFWLYGLKKQESMGECWSVVHRTEFYKTEQKWPGIEDWYVVSDDGSGNPIGIDPEGKVWLSDHDAGFEHIKLANSFEEFLYRIYTDTLYEVPD